MADAALQEAASAVIGGVDRLEALGMHPEWLSGVTFRLAAAALAGLAGLVGVIVLMMLTLLRLRIIRAMIGLLVLAVLALRGLLLAWAPQVRAATAGAGPLAAPPVLVCAALVAFSGIFHGAGPGMRYAYGFGLLACIMLDGLLFVVIDMRVACIASGLCAPLQRVGELHALALLLLAMQVLVMLMLGWYQVLCDSMVRDACRYEGNPWKSKLLWRRGKA